MGSGKTTVGRLLAWRTGRDFVDLDHEISRLEGRTIPEIFAEGGEDRFRDLEHAALLSALDRPEPAVISCGGGAITRPENRAALSQTPTVFLSEDVGALFERTRDADRPLRGGSRREVSPRHADRPPPHTE